MSVSSLRAQVRRLSQAWTPAGHVVVVKGHACQTEAELDARARAALGRAWRAGDVVILIALEGPCETGTHQHIDDVIVHARID
jgi:hypothetical protein